MHGYWDWCVFKHTQSLHKAYTEPTLLWGITYILPALHMQHIYNFCTWRLVACACAKMHLLMHVYGLQKLQKGYFCVGSV